jgi:hypothetical protein
MIRKEKGEPWFIHGVGFDITDLKRTEEALQEERKRRFRDSEYRGRVSRRAGPGRTHHPLQPRVRTDDGLLLRGGSGQIYLGRVPGS